jgi:hypothetical protein
MMPRPLGRLKPAPTTAWIALVGAALAFFAARGEAHKPITSPYTFNEDVAPILKDHCGRCHVSGGVAPMSLMTHQDTVPWGESLRLELIAGHMPPWSADSTAGRFRHSRHMTARELNTVLTWASGGTPPGDEAKSPPRVTLAQGWRLGAPDVVLPLPEVTLGADAQESIAEFVMPASGPPEGGPHTERWVRAIDLMPGTPAMVRSATITVRNAADAGAARTEVGASSPIDVRAAVRRPALLLWQPGDEPMALDGAAFRLPAGAELVVRIRYKKTWEYERKAMTDRSAVGLYFATGSLPEVRALHLTLPGLVLDDDLRVLAIAPDPALAGIDVRVDAARPDGSRQTLIAFRPAAGWARRYWFDTPVALPRGTRLGVSAASPGQTTPRLVLDIAQ